MPNGNSKKLTIDISIMALVKILVVAAILFFLIYIRSVILIVFVALILASAFDPWVDWMHKRKIPRGLGILIIYIILIGVLGGAVYLIIPPIITEVNDLSSDFPIYWEKITSGWSSFQAYSDSHGWGNNVQDSIDSVQGNLGLAAGGVFNTVFSFFGGIVSFFIILVITFYMTVEEQVMKRIMRSVVPTKYQPYFTHLANRMQMKIGKWLRGQLFLSLIIFLLSWLGLSVLGVKYALVLAVFAGVTELIPYFGPFIGGVPAVLIAFTQSPTLAILVIVLYVVIQLIENHVLVPKVMQKAVGLNPVVTIIVILIGAKLAGILGIILAVPVTTALGVAAKDLIEYKKK